MVAAYFSQKRPHISRFPCDSILGHLGRCNQYDRPGGATRRCGFHARYSGALDFGSLPTTCSTLTLTLLLLAMKNPGFTLHNKVSCESILRDVNRVSAWPLTFRYSITPIKEPMSSFAASGCPCSLSRHVPVLIELCRIAQDRTGDENASVDGDKHGMS